jgi:hypothetical protein
MKIVSFIAAAGVFFLVAGVHAAEHAHSSSHTHAAAKNHLPHTARKVRHARVYDASNVPTRTYGHKSSSFVPRRASKSAAHPGAATHASATRRPAVAVAPTRARPSPEARAHEDFRQDHPCPSTGWTTGSCPGYVIEPVKATKPGGAESLANLQWRATEPSQ